MDNEQQYITNRPPIERSQTSERERGALYGGGERRTTLVESYTVDPFCSRNFGNPSLASRVGQH